MSKKLWSTKADESPEFVEFWNAWRPMARETDGRGDARDAFLDHVMHGAEPQDIVDGAKWFLSRLQKHEYIPLVKTWLNRRAYEDLAEDYRAYESRRQDRLRAKEQPANVVNMISPERRAEMAAQARRAVGRP